jgi:hypothetical protein
MEIFQLGTFRHTVLTPEVTAIDKTNSEIINLIHLSIVTDLGAIANLCCDMAKTKSQIDDRPYSFNP